MENDPSLSFYNSFFRLYNILLQERKENENLSVFCQIDSLEPFKAFHLQGLSEGFLNIETPPDLQGTVSYHVVHYLRVKLVIKKSVKDPEEKQDFGFTLGSLYSCNPD
jgi:hypothetical protein